MGHLKNKLAKGGFWIFLERGGGVTISFVKITILTHYLIPIEFGIFGVALISVDILTSLSRSGFKQALIQKEGGISSYLNSAWTFRLLRYILLSILLYAIAPLAANFFNNSESVSVIRAFSFVIILRAFVNIADVYLEKKLDFKTLLFYNSGGLIADLLLSIIFAIVLRNYWALYIGYCSRILFRCIFSYLLFSYRPKIELDIVKIRELFKFGKWIFAVSTLGILSMYLDNILVGKLVGIAALGLYQVAFKFSHIGSAELYSVLSRLYFPYFSAIQNNVKESEEAYLTLLKLNVIFMVCIVTGMLCLAPAFTKLFLDPEWISIIPVIQILACASLLHSFISSANPFLKGRGHPQLMLIPQSVKILFLVIFILIISGKQGIIGIAKSVALAEFIALLAWFIILNKIIRGFFVRFIKIISPPIVAGILMSLSILILTSIDIDMSMTLFFTSGIIGVSTYYIVIFLYTKISSDYGTDIQIQKFYRTIRNKR